MSRKTNALVCEMCHKRNYKNTIKIKDRLELQKFCSHCNKHTLHKEGK